jgi:hypothetical protein
VPARLHGSGERLRRDRPLEEPPHVLEVALVGRIQGEDPERRLAVQPDRHRPLRDDDEDAGREHLGQAEGVVADRRGGLVEGVDHDHDPLVIARAPVGGTLEQESEEVGPAACRRRQHLLGAVGDQLAGAHHLGGQALEARGHTVGPAGQLDEVVDVAALGDQVRQVGRLADPRRGLEDEVAAILGGEEPVDLGGEPFAADELLDIHALEDRPRLDVGVAQQLVVADEHLVVVAGDQDAADDVAADDDAALAAGVAGDRRHRGGPVGLASRRVVVAGDDRATRRRS